MTATRRPLGALLLLATTACASLDMAALDDEGSGAEDGEAEVPVQLRLDIYPSDATPDLAPQSVLLDLDGDWRGLDLELSPSVTLSGTVQGFLATPYLAEDPTVPGEDDAPIAALVSVVLDDSVAGGTTTTDESGDFSLTVPPGQGYRLEIIPEDTDRVPFAVQTIPVLASDLDLGTISLDYGAPVWGQVLFSDGTVPAGSRVYLVDQASGVAGPQSLVDSDGWYQLRAYPGDYELVLNGREGSTVPTIVEPFSFDEDEGIRVDLDVGPSDRIDLGGYLVDASGDALVSQGGDSDGRYTVRCIASSLRDVDGELEVEDFTSAGGRFDLDLAAGSWRIELIPPYDSALSPRTLTVEVDDEDIELGDVVLEDKLDLLALVVDPDHAAAADALVVAKELAYNGYTYTGSTGTDGRTDIEVPAALLELSITPADPTSAAITRVVVDTATDVVDELQLSEGVPVQGNLSSEQEPVPFALVEVRDASGRLYATGLSDEEGAFRLRVDSEPSSTDQ